VSTDREARDLVEELHRHALAAGRPLDFMEVCGTHTVNACRGGIHTLVPEGVRLLSGPGCPVCVTPGRFVDALIDLGTRTGTIIATYGDLLRVTGSAGSLERARTDGADVRVVQSTIEALEIAHREPKSEVVFAAVGFETTAPATAAAVLQAENEGTPNFSVLPCHKLVLPAMLALLDDPEVRIDGFLCPGHVSVIIGADAYLPVVREFQRPCAVAGFDPKMILSGIVELADQAASGRAELVNLYPQVVRSDGNPTALALLDKVFTVADSVWRALGTIPMSGLDLKPEYARFDAFAKYSIELGEDRDPPGCRCGEVITGKCAPADCDLFGEACTPLDPIGPCMVSSEGTCRAWYRYRRREGGA
jgi:hydrogenase expression/formation protein HypD